MPDMNERQDRWYHRINPNWVGWAVTFAVAAAVALLSGKPIPPPPPLPDGPLFQGWVEDKEAVDSVQDKQAFKSFGETPAGRVVLGEEEKDVFLWDACRKVTGDILPARNQGQVGSCVSFGTASAIEHLLCVQIVLNGNKTQYKDLAQEVIYGGSRVQIGGGRIRGDGSVGAWAADFVQKYGVVARDAEELGQYSESRCREWGRSGVPDKYLKIAKESPVKSVVLVKNSGEAKKSIRQRYPIAVCSNQGFSFQRDKDGFAAPKGTWAHCMAIVGYTQEPRPGFFILNSWGDKIHTGPLGKGNPSPAGFWADEKVVDRMLAQGDSWAFSDAVGFPARKIDPIDWILRHDRPAHRGSEILAIGGAK